MPRNKPAPQVRLALTEEGLALTVRFTRDQIRNLDPDLAITEAHPQDTINAIDRLEISRLAQALTADYTQDFLTYTCTSELRLADLNEIAAALISPPDVKPDIKHFAGGTELTCVIDAALEKSLPTALRLQVAVHRSRLKLLARTSMLMPAEAAKVLGKKPATA
ncbi:hypothetical protein [Rhodobacter sp. 24-YEA-8]|uniref:hypothetical protein n=1 Tax=Rhodobacter sp. 24-YEA-8 TaxID=1884310 RepID=UPI00089D37A0|nr:hypothetical protein [Rhodobacter sp. 24-YEA-8]SED15883.1 hypothetical protein SAMN05519105_3491 [Rhodobacter sp. 24-YEA-8]